jgi:hypothetical protein
LTLSSALRPAPLPATEYVWHGGPPASTLISGGNDSKDSLRTALTSACRVSNPAA